MSDTVHLEGFVVAADGVKFPAAQVASSDVNTLDDYEEGTFAPTVKFGGASVGVSYTNQSGKYTKIGNRVFFSIQVNLSSKGSSTGALTLDGLPFSVGSAVTAAPYAENLSSITGQIIALLGGTAVSLYQIVTGAASALTNSNATDSLAVLISGHYTV